MIYRNDASIKLYDPKQPLGIDWDEPISTMELKKFDPTLITEIVWEMRTAIVLGSGGQCNWKPTRNLPNILSGVSSMIEDIQDRDDWYFYVEFDHTTGNIQNQRTYIDDGCHFSLNSFLEEIWSKKDSGTSLIIIWHTAETEGRSREECGTFLTIAPDVDKKLYKAGPNWLKYAPKVPSVHFWRSGWRTFPTITSGRQVRPAKCAVVAYYVDRKKLQPEHLLQVAELSYYTILGRTRMCGLSFDVAEAFIADYVPKRSNEYVVVLYYHPSSSGHHKYRGLLVPTSSYLNDNSRYAFLAFKQEDEDVMIIRRYTDTQATKHGNGSPNFTIKHYIER